MNARGYVGSFPVKLEHLPLIFNITVLILAHALLLPIMESENNSQNAERTANPMLIRAVILGVVALMVIGMATHMLPDGIIIPAFMIFCAGLITFSTSKPEGMDFRFIVLTMSVSFAYFILLNRYEAMSGGYFAFGKSLGFTLGEIPPLAVFILAIPVALTQNFVRSLPYNIYVRALAGSVLSAIPVVFVMYAGPLTDVLYWENLTPAPVVFISVFIVSFFLSFAGLQLNYKCETRFYRETYLSWILFWVAAFGIHLLMP